MTIDPAIPDGGSPRTFVHGDFRLDNMFFGAVDKDDVAVFDWQASGLGAAVYEVGYFLGASVTTEVRREIERETLQEYHDIVCRMGAKDFSFDDCWRLYRQSMLTGLVVPVLMCGSLNLTDERIRQLAELVLQRRLAAIDDLDAGELLPGRRRFSAVPMPFRHCPGAPTGLTRRHAVSVGQPAVEPWPNLLHKITNKGEFRSLAVPARPSGRPRRATIGVNPYPQRRRGTGVCAEASRPP